MAKLTRAQSEVLLAMGDGPSLQNGDEGRPQWWIEGGLAVHARTAEALVRMGLVEYCAHWGGHPGVLGYRVSDAGRAVLAEMGGRDAD